MNYIGSKLSLLDFLQDTIKSVNLNLALNPQTAFAVNCLLTHKDRSMGTIDITDIKLWTACKIVTDNSPCSMLCIYGYIYAT